MSNKVIVLDANILIRAALGKRVRELILEYAATVQFFASDVAFAGLKVRNAAKAADRQWQLSGSSMSKF